MRIYAVLEENKESRCFPAPENICLIKVNGYSPLVHNCTCFVKISESGSPRHHIRESRGSHSNIRAPRPDPHKHGRRTDAL